MMFTNRNISWEHKDRRPFFLVATSRFLRNKEHFDAIGESIEDPSFMRFAFDFFANRDLSNFDAARDRPETEQHRLMERRNCGVELEFFIEWGWSREHFLNRDTMKEKSVAVFQASMFVEEYNRFVKEKEFRVSSTKKFANRVDELISDGVKGVSRYIASNGPFKDRSVYEFDTKVFRDYLMKNNLMGEEKRQAVQEDSCVQYPLKFGPDD
jgi:hypothetical protein